MAQLLTEADVKRLITNPSGEVRAETAVKVAEAFELGELSASERALAEQIFRVMVQDAEVKVRESLASHLKSSANLPHDIALKMAKDVEQVALPVLEFSKVLSDADLIEIVRSSSAEKQTAVAKRAEVSGKVANALIDHGKSSGVVAALAANKGAALGDAEMKKILDKHGSDATVTNSLVARPNLPLALSERIVNIVSGSLRDYLVQCHYMSDEMAADLVLSAREKATIMLLPSGAKSTDVIEFAQQLHSAGRLSPTLLLRALCSGDIAFFEAAMSVLSGVPIINARLLIHDQGGLGMQSIFQYAHLPLDLFPAFRAAFDVARDMDYDGGDRDRQRFASKVIERVLTRLEQLDQRNAEYLLNRLQQLAA
ncbi:DUF2336 domain-containing protein [Dongia deserti]|uniref:DUF2336 domain-containing protein n=1 Tax=Dongia deserti TaxID=2268030 RepID=UPI00254703E8|nr:DUF2336 domain-containing protein [Dongia deserti]